MSTPTTNRRVLLDSSKPEKHASTPSKTPGRRVLGELASNTNIAPNKSTITSGKPQAPPSPSPRKQSRAFTTIQDENAPSNTQKVHLKARKRSIHEVGGSLAREDAIGSPAKRGRADLTTTSKPPIHVRPDSTATAPMTPTIDFQRPSLKRGSSEPEPTPINTQETIGNKSFSSLIDYTAAASPKLQTVSPPEPAETRVKTQAETLRLRLRAALYKVKTDQIFIPLGSLEIPEQYQRKPAEVADVASTGQQTPPHSQPEPDTTEAATTGNLSPSATALKPLPGPLQPTAYSTRFVETPHLPSSPPATAPGNDEDADADTPRPMTPHEKADPTTPVARHASVPAQQQLSSPPGSGSAENEEEEARRAATESELTSSVRKGRAASGLLELMRSA